MARGVCGYPDESCPRIACDPDFEGCSPGLVHKLGRDKRFSLKMKMDVKLTLLFWFISVIQMWTYIHWKFGGHWHESFVQKSVSQVIFVRMFLFFPILTIHVDFIFSFSLHRVLQGDWDEDAVYIETGNAFQRPVAMTPNENFSGFAFLRSHSGLLSQISVGKNLRGV